MEREVYFYAPFFPSLFLPSDLIINNTKAFLHIKSKVHYISILDDVFFSFHTKLSCLFTCSLRAVLHEVFILHYFSTNKSFFEIRVNNSCCLWCCRTFQNSPSANFFYTCSKISI